MRAVWTILCCLLVLPVAWGDDFFSGTDLTGWEGLKEHWEAKDGAIHGTTQPKGINFNTFLCSKKEYGDFELKLKVKLVNGVGNSGIQVRSSVKDPKKYVVAGPQCDMGQQYWGSLYGEQFGGMMKASNAEQVKKVVKPKDWNDYHIVCKGKHVTIKINGETMLDGDFAKMPDKGIIAFQIHGGPAMDVYFKDIVFTELK
ncbi:MAG: DUF1080 domain-containing protein [Gemmatales bacterium]